MDIKVPVYPKFIETPDGGGYDIKDIAKFLGRDMYRKFNNWFAGQTGEIGKDAEGKPVYLVYKSDFEKFLDFIGLSVG